MRLQLHGQIMICIRPQCHVYLQVYKTRTGLKMRRYSQQSTSKNLLLLKKLHPYIPISVSNHILYGLRRGRRRPCTMGWSSALYKGVDHGSWGS